MRVDSPLFPTLPRDIAGLSELAYNLWWTWNMPARALFRSIDRTLWRKTHHNPVQMLREIPNDQWTLLARDEAFQNDYQGVMEQFKAYMNPDRTWFSERGRQQEPLSIAYFCAEFAVHTSLPIYSGGLGLLAGDTCKEASDLGIPFTAIGALYPEGYFHQRVDPDGAQEAIYERIDTSNTALLPVLNDDGSRLLVGVPVGDRQIYVALWRVQVGRVPIYLLDSNIDANEAWDRDLVARLYGGDNQVRLRQEIILGIGGYRVVKALGLEPTVVHMNEGHAAFASLEIMRQEIEGGRSFEQALDCVRRKLVFTTHTPVKAGHDEFPFYMMEEQFTLFWGETGMAREQFLALGRAPGGQNFSMTVLALNTARCSNGVSRKHGEVSREMWHFLYPYLQVEKVPIISITNGVHVPTWLDGEIGPLLDRYLGPDWFDRHDDPEVWQGVFHIPDEDLWRAHTKLKHKLLNFIRERARVRWRGGAASPGQMVAMGSLLTADALTIGFARRFATYKRATLVFHDLERLKAILLNSWRPVQIIFAGKPHPADEPGKMFLKYVYQAAAAFELEGRIAFIENYDKHVAHHLVSGVDLWLNTPEPPKEASGTSGQKASLNGVANFSILDGWWYEGFNGRNGWAIADDSDKAAADSLYSLLENQIVPLFYERNEWDLPAGWVRLMKEAISSTAAPFSARRMVKEYLSRMYQPSGVGSCREEVLKS